MRQPEPCSPCRQLCRLNRAGVCIGCGRSIDEIAQWPDLEEAARQRIIDRLRASHGASEPPLR